MEKGFKIVIAIFVVLFSVMVFVFYFFVPFETQVIKMHIGVSNYTGFNVDADALYFGTVPGKGISSRDLVINNTVDTNIIIHMSFEGSISKFISVSKNDFVIRIGDSETITVTADVPEGAQLGEYTGYLYVVFRRAIF